MPFTVRNATTDDADAIAKIFTSNETSDFLRLQLGTVDPEDLNKDMTGYLAKQIQKSEQAWIIACDDETAEIVSYAQWMLPRDEFETVVEKTADEKAQETEDYRNRLLPGMNEALSMDFREKIHTMREEILKGRRHYLLGNIGTLPWYKRKGAATALSRWPLEDADRDKVIVYLDTDQEGEARRIYEKLCFERAGMAAFDLAEYGSSGVHIHIGMIREPR